MQGAAADAEAKSEELSRAVEELHKLLKDAGEGATLQQNTHNYINDIIKCLVEKIMIKLCGLNTVLLFSPPPTANKALEEKLQERSGATDKTVAELKERIKGLEKELDNANDLLSSSKLRGQSL